MYVILVHGFLAIQTRIFLGLCAFIQLILYPYSYIYNFFVLFCVVYSDGFRQLLCEASSCIGIAGNQLKFYTFACKLDSK